MASADSGVVPGCEDTRLEAKHTEKPGLTDIDHKRQKNYKIPNQLDLLERLCLRGMRQAREQRGDDNAGPA